MNQTFYKVFVGGETVPGCQATVDKYAQKGVSFPWISRLSYLQKADFLSHSPWQVGIMFNYSAEAPLGASKPSSGIDQNCMREIHSAVVEAGKLSSPPIASTSTAPPSSSVVKPSLLAIKLTGLIYDASLLTRASNALASNTSFQRGEAFSPSAPSSSSSNDDSSTSSVFPQSPELSDEDHVQLGALYEGLRKVAGEARRQGVRLLVDAEQSWFQPA